MLLEFSCSNHKSIRDTILFSTLASSDSTFSDRLGIVEDNKVLKSAVIYGANGSGKSNLISAIAFVKTLVMNSVNYQIGQGIGQQPNKLSGFEKESNYKIQFVTKGIRYAYHFSINVTDCMSCPRTALFSCPPTALIPVQGTDCFAGRIVLPVFDF